MWRAATESGTGSGVIIRADGYILTNNHVVAVAANGGTITADFYQGHARRCPARIVGRDPKTDLAVVRVDRHRPAGGDSSASPRAWWWGIRSWLSARRSACPAPSPQESSAPSTVTSMCPSETGGSRWAAHRSHPDRCGDQPG